MRTYVLVGAGHRAYEMYAKAIAGEYKDVAKLVGVFDKNLKRAAFVRDNTDPSAPVFADFDQMMEAARPHCAIIATVDAFHDEYIDRAYRYGCDVVCEKPIATTAAQCARALAAERRAGKRTTVVFNYRFVPYVTRVKELLEDGVVGDILHIDVEYLLDTSHGADYFRRWHRYKRNSGGLLVHKATHHFDFISWWLDARPETVYAHGSLRFYGPGGAVRGERCLTCAHKDTCAYAFKHAGDDAMRGLYFDAEAEDGYHRDGCIFSEDIDIEDTMSVNVRYDSGALLTYSLIAYSPYEGWRTTITGTKGRMEAAQYLSGGRAAEPDEQVYVYNRRGERLTYDVPKASGAHGGADALVRRMLFLGETPAPASLAAHSDDGVRAAMIGICANMSIASGQAVDVEKTLEEAAR